MCFLQSQMLRGEFLASTTNVFSDVFRWILEESHPLLTARLAASTAPNKAKQKPGIKNAT